MKARLGPLEFTALAASMMSLFAFSIDATLPALAYMGEDLKVDAENRNQLIIFVIVLGMGIGQLAYGPLSDITGRKPAIYMGLAIYAAGCLMSMSASEFPTMLVGRLLQGLGAAGPRIVTLALIRDQYAGTEMARIMSFVIAILMIGPILAPFLGQAILQLGSWRYIFASFFLFALAIWGWLAIRQPETLPVARRARFAIAPIKYALRETLGSKVAIRYSLVAGIAFGELFAYIGSTQQIYQGLYGVGALFPVYLALSAVGIASASIANASLVRRLGMKRLCSAAARAKAMIATVILLFGLAHSGMPPLSAFVALSAVFFFLLGVMFGNLNSMALEPLGHVAGVASGILGSLSWMVATALGSAIGLAFDGTTLPLSTGLVMLAALSIILLQQPESSAATPNR